jgi:hypothetical protein
VHVEHQDDGSRLGKVVEQLVADLQFHDGPVLALRARIAANNVFTRSTTAVPDRFSNRDQQ